MRMQLCKNLLVEKLKYALQKHKKGTNLTFINKIHDQHKRPLLVKLVLSDFKVQTTTSWAELLFQALNWKFLQSDKPMFILQTMKICTKQLCAHENIIKTMVAQNVMIG